MHKPANFSVLHNRLLRKVESYGICVKSLNWIKGFVMDRDRCMVLMVVNIDGKGTKWSPSRVNSGTSILFTIY